MKSEMKCRACRGSLQLKIGWRRVTLCCMECGRKFSLEEYIDELDAKNWDQISGRSCDRV